MRPLFVAQTTWFWIPDFCNTELEWVGHGVDDHELMAMTYRWALGWWKDPCGVLSHLYQRECASGEV